MSDQLNRIEDKVDALAKEVVDLRVAVEHRVTKLEAKAGIIGVVTGLLGGLLGHVKDG